MTSLQKVNLELQKFGISVSKTEDGEYRESSPKGEDPEASYYFTDDLEDAIETARSMIKQQPPSNHLTSSKAVDRVSTHLERLTTEMPREAGHLRDIVLRLDRVANTLEAEESVSQRVSQVENELEGLGIDFTVEPNSSHKSATCIYAYRGQLDPREEPAILGRVAKKYGSVFENTSQNQPYKITIPHN